MEDGLWARLSIFQWFNPRGVRLAELLAIAVVIDVARTLQRDRVRRLRTGFLLRLLRLRFECGRFGGFADKAVGTAD